MDFRSMFEEMHRSMAEMMEVRQAMMDRMFAGFGRSMFPSFPALVEDFDREFDFPRLTMAVPPLGTRSLALNQPQPQQNQQQAPQLQASTCSGCSVMYSSEQYYNSLDPKKNYSRHTTTQAGPSGVLESRTALRDNGEGVERVEVRRQLGDRFTHMGRKRRLDTGEETVEKTGHNISNEEMAQFEQEWLKVAKENLPLYVHGAMAGLPLEGEQQQQQQPPQLEQHQQPQKKMEQPSEGGSIPIGKLPAQAQPTAMLQ